MPRLAAMTERLPSLYRPEPDDTSLLTAFLRAVSDVLDHLGRDAGDVLQSRWIRYADRAEFVRFFELSLSLDPSLDPLEHPYIRDLARLASLLPLPPWEEPPAYRENVEEYRLRILRIVDLYRNGLGTVEAIRRIVEAELPVDLLAPPERRDRPFSVEEFAPFETGIQVPTRGAPDLVVGPLMRWTLTNGGVAPAAPTIHVGGIAEEPGEKDATIDPVIELYKAGSDFLRVGIAFEGTVAPGDALRLRPAYSSWLGMTDVVLRARALPADDAPADPTADGPWEAVPDSPIEAVFALLQTRDHMLWVAVGPEGSASLWRYDGTTWTEALSGEPTIRCLLEEDDNLLLGTDGGLLRLGQHPSDGVTFVADPVPAAGSRPVHDLFRGADGTVWLGTDAGAFQLGAGDTVVPFVLGSETSLEVAVFAIAEDHTGSLFFGTSLGLFQHQPKMGSWYWYEGRERTEQALDWLSFDPSASEGERGFPESGDPFLPPVRCVHRGPDASLWIGTDAGLARYVARPPLSPGRTGRVNSLTFETVLEAFPDLVEGPVYEIREDERGGVWFATEEGLFRFDGRDFWQYRVDHWEQMGRADQLYPEGRESGSRGAWRFSRAGGTWQRFDLAASTWSDFVDPVRSTDEPRVRALLWTDDVDAHTGAWDGATLSAPTPVDPALLNVRFKPSEDRIVTGGLPAVPRLPVGSSTWRYLRREGPEPAAPEPTSWTSEGRLRAPPPEGLDEAPGPARFDVEQPFPPSYFDQSVFGFHPCAQVWVSWQARRERSVLVRLREPPDREPLDPAILDRVWSGIELVRPAGVETKLAVEEKIVRGNHGND